jgi:translation initiation factor 1
MKGGGRIPTDGGRPLGQNPFSGLAPSHTEAPAPEDRSRRPEVSAAKPTQNPEPRTQNSATKNRGRVDITRQTAGRGGKTVTVVSGFAGIGQPEKEQLAKRMQKACGTGGTVKEGRIEIQGDKREQVARILAEAGFRPVFAGG